MNRKSRPSPSSTRSTSRRKHLPPRPLRLRGPRSRIERDAELRRYVEKRLRDPATTFEALAADCLARFGRPRAPSRASLWRYWARRTGQVREDGLRIGRIRRPVSGRLTVEELIHRLSRSAKLDDGAVIPLDIAAGRFLLKAALVVVRLRNLRRP